MFFTAIIFNATTAKGVKFYWKVVDVASTNRDNLRKLHIFQRLCLFTPTKIAQLRLLKLSECDGTK